MKAKAWQPTPGKMNGTEREYAKHLDAEKAAGNIRLYRFEKVKLKLADKCFYTPDFMVIDAEGRIRFDEVKGFWRDDAKVKTRVVAEQFPEFRFLIVQKRAKKRGGGWDIEQF